MANRVIQARQTVIDSRYVHLAAVTSLSGVSSSCSFPSVLQLRCPRSLIDHGDRFDILPTVNVRL